MTDDTNSATETDDTHSATRRTVLKTAGALGLAGLAGTGTAGASDHPRYVPRGPWPGDLQAINLNGFHTNDQLTAELEQMARRSDRLDLRKVAESAGRGDPVWEATVGDGDTSVHLVTQIHGDEPVGTEVALKVLRELALGDSARVEHLLEELTFTVVPRVNPDGAMFEYDVDDDGREEWVARRYNTQEWSAGDSRHEPWYHYYYPEGYTPGYDMNRDFNIRPPGEFDPSEDAEADWWRQDDGHWYVDQPYEGYTLPNVGLRMTPEVRGVTRSYLEADPDFAITHHHMGANLVPGSDGPGGKPPKQTVMAVMAQYGPSYFDRSPFQFDGADPVDLTNPFVDEATSTRSIRLNALVANALAERGDSVFDSVTRYGYFPIWGSYLDALTPNTDAAGMLYEVAYQSDMIGHMKLGQMMEATKVGFLESFEAIADGTLDDVAVEDYFDVPLTGGSLDNPHLDQPPR